MGLFHRLGKGLQDLTGRPLTRGQSSAQQKSDRAGADAPPAGEGFRRGAQKEQTAWRGRSGWQKSAVRSGREEPSGTVWRTADGYVRRTPVQPVYEPPSYRRRILIRLVWGILLAAVLLFLLNFFLNSSLVAR